MVVVVVGAEGGGGCLTLLEINSKRVRAKKATSEIGNVVSN